MVVTRLLQRLSRTAFGESAVARMRRQAVEHTSLVALGFARMRPGTGGVRRHLECIRDYCRHRVTLFPDAKLCDLANRHDEWAQVTAAVPALPLHGFPIVHSHVNPEFITACRCAQQRGSAWVHTYHTLYFPEDWGGQLLKWQEDINRSLIEEARYADVRISISGWLRDLLLDRYDIATIVIPNGVDAERCAAVARLRDPNLPDDFILFSGSSRPVKNPAMFVCLAELVPEMNFVMIGEGLLPQDLSQCLNRKLPPNLLPLGPQSHENALSLMKTANALIVTSHSEGLPTAVLEAMAMGTTVVVPDSFGCRDLVTHRKTGFVFNPGSLEELRTIVVESLATPTTGAAAGEMIRTQFAWPAVAAQLDSLYAGLISRA